MKRYIIVAIVLAASTVDTQACGPVRRLASNMKQRIETVRSHARSAVHKIVDVPFNVAEAKPVRTAIQHVMTAPTKSRCTSGNCP